MPDSPVCWKCGASLAELSLPLLPHDACMQCGVELHVCKLCRFYDVTVAKRCREPIAELVRDKERANFCDYFEIKRQTEAPPTAQAAVAARNELEAMFGKSATKTDDQYPTGS
jgi:hypothetical protein